MAGEMTGTDFLDCLTKGENFTSDTIRRLIESLGIVEILLVFVS
jgi:hypothetical protein